MNNQDYLKKIKKIQDLLLNYIEDEKETEENFSALIKNIDEQKIQVSRPDFKLFLYLLSKIINNHHRNPIFFKKIERILQNYHNEIKSHLSNSEIFNIFKGNKKVILFLIKLNLIKFNKNIVKIITNYKYKAAQYPQYFSPEIKQFIESGKQNLFNEKDIENFEEKRNTGENDSIVCELIRNDSIKEFVIYVTKNNLPLKNNIKPSIFETNPFLIENSSPTLIEYAAFFGSIEIFQYLRLNNVPLTSSLWPYAIHGQNSDIIHLLEENHITPPIISDFETDNDDENEEEEEECDDKKDNLYKNCLIESIKCHHIDIAKYILNNYCQSESKKLLHSIFSLSLKYYNFAHIQDELVNEASFYELCQYGYFSLADNLLKEKSININEIHKRDKTIKEKIEVDRFIDDEPFGHPRIISVIKRKIRLDTPLYISIKKQNFDISKLLIKKEEIDINILNKGLTVEVPAMKKLYPNEIKTQRTAFTTAIEAGSIEIVNELLSKENLNADVLSIYDDLHKWGPGHEQGQYTTEKPPLYIAYEKEENDIYKLLISNEKVDLNQKYKFIQMNPHGIFENFTVNIDSLLNVFIEKQDIENIKLLLSNDKIDVNSFNEVQTYSQYTQIFRGKQTVGFNSKKIAALQIAAEKGNIEVVKLLLNNKNIDIDVEDENGFDLSESTKDPQIQQLFKDAISKAQAERKFVIEPICTYEASGEAMIEQRFFVCKTCGVQQDGNYVDGFCEVCARKCHKGHNIFCPCGLVESFCDCPNSGKCNCNKHESVLKCTGEVTNGTPVDQPMYQCKDCGIVGQSYICQSCAINHHHGHKLIFTYRVRNAVCCNYHHE